MLIGNPEKRLKRTYEKHVELSNTNFIKLLHHEPLLALLSFLDCRSLGRMEQTAKAYRNKKMVEEAAKMAVAKNPRRSCAPMAAGLTWLRILHELDALVQPLRFSTAPAGIALHTQDLTPYDPMCDTDEGDGRGTTATYYYHRGCFGTATCSLAPMRAGVHAANFRILNCGPRAEAIKVGIVKSSARECQRAPPTSIGWRRQVGYFICHKAESPKYYCGASATENGWGWCGETGSLCHKQHSDDGYPGGWGQRWDGQQGYDKGDTVGLRLDLDLGTLTAYKNGTRLGVIATGLSGTFCWGVDLCDSQELANARGYYDDGLGGDNTGTCMSVRIQSAPATSTQDELAAQKRQEEQKGLGNVWRREGDEDSDEEGDWW